MRDRMGRRVTARLLAGAAVALSLPARAQQPAGPLIGFLSSRSPDESALHVEGFLRGLRALGYVDGRTAEIDYRWARGDYARLPTLVSELVARRPAVIATFGGASPALAAKQATRTIPILFLSSVSVSAGLVTSLNRPEANLTGIDFVSTELGSKRLELLSQLAPAPATMGFLLNSQNEYAPAATRIVREAADTLGRRLVTAQASGEGTLASAFAALAADSVKALVVQNDPAFDSWRGRLTALAASHGIAAIYHIREFPLGGGLMSYGASLADCYHQAGVMAGRILKGAAVADLPVERPTRFELVINLKVAAALGLSIPPTLMARADELIE